MKETEWGKRRQGKHDADGEKGEKLLHCRQWQEHNDLLALF